MSLPVIANPAEGAAEQVPRRGTGFLVVEDDPPQLAEYAIELLTDTVWPEKRAKPAVSTRSIESR